VQCFRYSSPIQLTYKRKRNAAPLLPLKTFNFELVRDRLDGLLFNIDRSLERRLNVARKQSDGVAIQQLLQMMAFVRCDCQFVSRPSISNRGRSTRLQTQTNFVLAIPPVNRQFHIFESLRFCVAW